MLSYKDAVAMFLNSKVSDRKDVNARAKTESEQKITMFFMTGSLVMMTQGITCANTASG
jgi:hypothetical protein